MICCHGPSKYIRVPAPAPLPPLSSMILLWDHCIKWQTIAVGSVSLSRHAWSPHDDEDHDENDIDRFLCISTSTMSLLLIHYTMLYIFSFSSFTLIITKKKKNTAVYTPTHMYTFCRWGSKKLRTIYHSHNKRPQQIEWHIREKRKKIILTQRSIQTPPYCRVTNNPAVTQLKQQQ